MKTGAACLEFSHEELDDLVGYLSFCANHEKSTKEQKAWDDLCDRLQDLLEQPERAEEDEA